MARIEVSPDGATIENARLPFKEQIAFFRQKLGNLIPTKRWDDIQKSAHDKGFMVAGAMKADLLADLAKAVDRAIAEGKSIQWFRQNFLEIVRKHGWAGFTGDDRTSGKPKGGQGIAWRTRVIYQTNLLTSYSAGRLAQLKEGGFKYWIYHHDDSVRHPRPLHQAWDGLTLPADHDFWKTHYPPNGWGCQCYLSGARSERGARRLGGDPDKRIDPEWLKTDPKTGAPVGIDKGWDYQPGATVVFDRNAAQPVRIMEGHKTWKDYGLPDIRQVPDALRPPAPKLLPKAGNQAQALAMLAEALRVSLETPRRYVETPLDGDLSRLIVDYDHLAHMVEKRADARERFANFILPTLTDPFEVWAALYEDGTLRHRFIGLFRGKRQLAAIIRVNKDGSLFYNFMNANDKRLNAFRAGVLLRSKAEKGEEQ